MAARWLALAAAVWTAGYVAVYVIAVRHDGNSPAWWYVGLLGIGMLLLLAAAAGWWSRSVVIVGTVGLALSAALGLLTIGLLLLPAVVSAIVASSMMKSPAHAAAEPR